jgi:tetratricopeptide (TPR) repeat protein
MDHGDKDKHPGAGARPNLIKGVFSTQSVAKVGTGSTTRRTIQKTYWSVLEKDSGLVEVQPLNKNYVPSGPKREVDKEEFLAQFNPEPEFYFQTVAPRLRELEMTVERGEKNRSEGKTYSAEFEFGTALSVDEEHVRANFGLGLTYLDRGEKNKANDIFERLVKLDAAFEPEHKHLFNDFGISMRKNGMLDQALDYYLRAAELAQDDEHLHHNIARAYFEKGDIENCLASLKRSLELNPDLAESLQFLKFLESKGYLKDGRPVRQPQPPDPAPGRASALDSVPGDPDDDAPPSSSMKFNI